MQSPKLMAMVLLVVALGSAAPAEEALSEARLTATLAEIQARYGFPGATAAVILDDGTQIDAAVGLADLEAEVAMTPDHRMLAASIGKTFVGAMILALESDGVLARSDRVAVHLGHLAWFDALPNAAEMTIAHLLTHRAGLPDHVHIDGVVTALIAAAADGQANPEDAIAAILEEPALFPAGDGWSYSDTGYLLLGLVIEAATGERYEDLVTARLLTPLGLTATAPSNRPDLSGLAIGYTVAENAFDLPVRTADDAGVLVWNPAIEGTGGGVVSTAHDLALWGRALFTGMALEGPYLSRLLEAEPLTADTPTTLYGPGVGVFLETPYGPVYGHGGWIPGYVSSLRYYADHDVTIAFQINTDMGVVDDSSDVIPVLASALADLVIAAGGAP